MRRTRADIAHDLGRRLRHRRHRAGLTQAAAAGLAGTSSSTVSRMELGHGETVPLGVWLALAEVVGEDVVSRSADREALYVDALSRLASDGGWALAGRRDDLAWLDRPAFPIRYVTTVLRPAERAIVRVVSVLTDIDVEVGRLKADTREWREREPNGQRLEGLLVIVRTPDNVRLAGRAARRSTDGWLMALRDRRAAMPSRPGVVWMTRRGTHLLPVA